MAREERTGDERMAREERRRVREEREERIGDKRRIKEEREDERKENGTG